MKSVGFPINTKENEYRRAIVPKDLDFIDNPEQIYIENGYGDILGYTDDEYKEMGCNIVSRAEVLSKEIICDPKVGDSDYLTNLKQETIIFGWVHAVQSPKITDILLEKRLTAIAWEDMYEENKHVFWKNNVLAGEAAILHASLYMGDLPRNLRAAVIGRGNTALGAVQMLSRLGAEIEQFSRKEESLFKKKLKTFDIIVNCVLWDIKRKDNIISKSDLKNMKDGSIIIDISCDAGGAIETSLPTTIENPIYVVDGITHYVVDHTPSLFFKTFTKDYSSIIAKYINLMMNDCTDSVLENAKIIDNGTILDSKIIDFQKR